jgi:hypothetical protein
MCGIWHIPFDIPLLTDEILLCCFQQLPHHADCPDLALCDFFLFGYLKEKLEEIVL